MSNENEYLSNVKSIKWNLVSGLVIIESVGWWVAGWWVAGWWTVKWSVVKRSVVGKLVVIRFNKTLHY